MAGTTRPADRAVRCDGCSTRALQQASFLSLVDGHVLISWLAIAGGLLLTARACDIRGEMRLLGIGVGKTLFAAALAFGTIVVISGAYIVALRGTSLTPERLMVMFASAILLLPFFIAFELTLRRGTKPVAALLGAIGRVLILASIALGLGLGTLPLVLGLVLPLFVIQFVMFEVFAAAVYNVSGSLLLIAIVEAMWFARAAALSWPITFEF